MCPTHPTHPARPSRPTSGSSPLRTLDDAFVALTRPPRALSIDGSEVPGLPERPIPLDELRSRLLHPSTPFVTRDAALAVVVRRAQHDGGTWVVGLIGLIGLLGPGLGRISASLTRACPARRADIEAEMLAELIAAIATTDPDQCRLAARLTWAARRGALGVVRAELSERSRPAHHPVSQEPPRPWGHPDLVLVRAVDEGVISATDAELIGATRLGEMTMRQAAEKWGATYQAIRHRRVRAEARLVAWIRDGFGTEPTRTSDYPGAGGRPRQANPTGGRDAHTPQPPHPPRR